MREGGVAVKSDRRGGALGDFVRCVRFFFVGFAQFPA